MPTQIKNDATAPWFLEHSISAEDQTAMAAMRAIVTPNKGKLQGIQARVPFGGIMERVVAPEAIDYVADKIGGIPGWWCRPANAPSDQAIMHVHGGWFSWGSAESFRHLAGHIAARAGIAVFLPDYRLAPEHPFPAAFEDVKAAYVGLAESGYSKIAVTGDSAGGNLALALLVYLAQSGGTSGDALIGGVAISPVTDLSLSGESWSSRAEADPLFTKPQASGLVEAYLVGHKSEDPIASPLFADLEGLAPIRVHVGNDEVLLDDSVRLVERAVAAGVDARLDVWNGMIHGFLGSVGRLEASSQALQAIGQFLRHRFAE
ncbi:alpha/beta hydrolase [Granulicella tundricola]|uniref:Esterase n=1 Tax=Granulicella tundricola (strain ATCC BAA-1859 / DSM 23138 / MP5ACTX9) TaxID=1198114 RepID=E8WWB1_GRATM|nr:alpha/beta hydrolase [Granulicella tundricola]ADW68494.1 esterase [Granulicella tundricola MP5ACTX9]